MSWRVFHASVAGPGKREDACQDASAYRVLGDRLAAVVCDGAGSAASSDLGAQLASHRVAEELMLAKLDPQGIERAIEHTRDALEDHCLRHGLALADLATTMVGVAVSAEGGWLFHVGDGVAAATSRPDADVLVSKPENGEYSNETFFVTSEAWRSHLRITRVPFVPSSVLLMSDGAQPFAMTRGCVAPFEPFLAPVERYLRSATLEAGSAALVKMLRDPRLDAITSDDKTLLIAQWEAP